MPLYDKGNVRIHYEEAGSGFPLLVIPGGGLNSTIRKYSQVTSVQPAGRIQRRIPRHRRRSAQRQWRSIDGSARNQPAVGIPVPTTISG